MGPCALRGYYAILDVRGAAGAPGEGVDLGRELMRAEELLAARPCCLQLRAKQVPERAVLALARALVPLCHRYDVPFCLNDWVDLALLSGADVVHLGQDDLALADARRVLSLVAPASPLRIGVSTHSLAQALAAAAEGADHIGFGPVFATTSKERPDPVVGLAGLREVAAAVALPVVAIGGITRARLGQVVDTGAAAAAVIGDIDGASDRAAAAREVAEAFGSKHEISHMA